MLLVSSDALDSNLTPKWHCVQKIKSGGVHLMLVGAFAVRVFAGKVFIFHCQMEHEGSDFAQLKNFVFSQGCSQEQEQSLFPSVHFILHRKLQCPAPALGPSHRWRPAHDLYTPFMTGSPLSTPLWLPISLNDHSFICLYIPHMVCSPKPDEEKALFRWGDKNKDLPHPSWCENHFLAPCVGAFTLHATMSTFLCWIRLY